MVERGRNVLAKSVALRETDQALIARCSQHNVRMDEIIRRIAYNPPTDDDIAWLREINQDFIALVGVFRLWLSENGRKR